LDHYENQAASADTSMRVEHGAQGIPWVTIDFPYLSPVDLPLRRRLR